MITKTPTHIVSNRFTIFNNHHLKNSQINITNKLLNLLKQCPNETTLQQVHTQLLVNSIQKPNFILTKLVANLKHFTYAYRLFTQIENPTDYSFNIMIRGSTSTWRNHTLTVRLYYQMKLFGVTPNNFTYPFLFISCGNIEALDHGRIGHSMVVKAGFDNDGHVCHSLITMYARCGVLDDARRVFDGIAEKDLVSWNSMISGYSKMGSAREAVGLFVEMRERGFLPDEMSLVSVLVAYGNLGDLESGKLVEGLIIERKMELNSFLGSALINMYGKCGDLAAARRVFDAMAKKKDVVIWNAMITGYAQNGASHEAISLFNDMRKCETTPDKITLIEVLSACASVGALDLGKWVETCAIQRGLQHDVYVGSGLIDMYSKCGSLGDARRVFGKLPHKNVVSWNAIISALAFHGQAQDALSLFRKMTKNSGGATPDDITFIGVLSACVHAGLIDEGRRLFNSMMSSFGLAPKIEHYSCMVDLLARRGHLNEAWDIIEKMPEKPDAILLGALLCACQKKKNIEVSERVIQLLLNSEASNSGNYVISSKIYAKLRMWDESAKMRVLMKQQGVVKTPGCSWIEIECQVNEFHAGDSLPCEAMEMYKVLLEEMKKEGYVPQTHFI